MTGINCQSSLLNSKITPNGKNRVFTITIKKGHKMIALVILHVERARNSQSSVPVQGTRQPLVASNAPDSKQHPTDATL